MAYSIFDAFTLAAHAGIFCCLQDSRAIVGMNLLQRRGSVQVLGRVAENLLIGGTVVQATAVAVDQRDHIGGIFADELKKLISFGQLAPNTVKLGVLVNGVEVEKQYQSCQRAHPFPEVEPVGRVRVPTKPGKSK